MKTWPSNTLRAAIIAFALVTFPAAGALVQLISKPDSSFAPSASGGGDSGLPIISADGRYVLFASTANNLALTTNSTAIPALFPPPLNVFLRDRTNNTTTLVSVNFAGTGFGDGNSVPAGLSTNGQYALFESAASNLIAGDTNNASDVFVRDLVNGTTLLVSVSTNGGIGSGASRDAVMTPNGQLVAFVSTATNLVAGDTNRIPDVFIRDLQANATTRVSVGAIATGFTTFTGSSESPRITLDGRFVAFFSTATNLVTGVRLAGEVYVRDLIGGTTVWASTNARAIHQSVTGSSNAISFNQSISADGQFVAFETCTNSPNAAFGRGIILRYNVQTGLTDIIHSNANVALLPFENMRSLDMTPDGRFVAFVANIGSAVGTNSAIYLWDAQTGTNTLVSADLSNAIAAGICDSPVVSSNGQYIAFVSNATNLTSNGLAEGFHTFVRDVLAGSTQLADADTNGVGSEVDWTTVPSLSADGRSVAFECVNGNLVPDDRNRAYDVFVRDLATEAIELVSIRHPALPSQTPNGFSGISSFSVSANGRYVAFASDADDVALNDTNGFKDVFLRDSVTGTNLLVSVGTNGTFSGDNLSAEPAISGDGRYVAFSSWAGNLVAGDTNQLQDVFVRDLQTGSTVLVNTNGGNSVSDNPLSPVISADGRYVLYLNRGTNIYMRDLLSSATYAPGRISAVGIPSVAMTPDGRYVAFIGVPANLYVWDSQLNTMVYTNTTPGISAVGIGISPDGNRLIFSTSTQLFVADRAAQTSVAIGSAVAGLHRGLRFSGDGHFVVYSTRVSNTNQVYLYDVQTVTNRLVSKSFNSSAGANGISDSPDISADGRFIVYRSAATNIVAGDNNGFPDLFVYDRVADTTSLLTQSHLGAVSGDNRSLKPAFSGNGRVLLFQSWASDLFGNDFNQNGDVFSFAFLYADIVGGNPPTITWPAIPGQTYHLQFKDSLSDAVWQEVPGSITIVGNQAYLTDPAPTAGQRFYRVVAE